MKVLALGASRNIGYYASLRLLAEGATVTFLLRKKAVFDGDAAIAPHVQSGKVRIVEGDALKEDDVRRAWTVAAEGDGRVDVVLFTVGGTPHFTLTSGFVLDPPDLCTRSTLNLLSTLPSTQEPPPRFIFVSSTGLTTASHKVVPLALKPLYSVVIRAPHVDKLGMERVVTHAAGWAWDDSREPSATVLPPKERWASRVPEGSVRDVVVLRPALYTDGKCKGDEGGANPYRAEDKELSGAYTISRKDVAHFIVERVLKDWDAWKGKRVRLAY